MNATSGEVIINANRSGWFAEAAERGYKDAMSSGVQEASSLKR
jgi:hypothetical protein